MGCLADWQRLSRQLAAASRGCQQHCCFFSLLATELPEYVLLTTALGLRTKTLDITIFLTNEITDVFE